MTGGAGDQVVAVVARRTRRRRPGSAGPVLLVLFVVVMVAVGRLTEPAAHGRGEIVLESAQTAGTHPFTASVATGPPAAAPAPASPAGHAAPGPSGATTTAISTTRGSQPGLYGGTRNAASCDAQLLIQDLQASPGQAAAFAEVEGITLPDIPSFAGGLTGVVLRGDTRVTDHGFVKDHPSVFQAVLQAGTRVLVDHFGVPRVRCAGGTPLGPPVAVVITPRYVGTRWAGFEPAGVSVVTAASQPVSTLVLVDGATGARFNRPVATGGQADRDAPAAAAAS
jgi:hypothetical protein